MNQNIDVFSYKKLKDFYLNKKYCLVCGSKLQTYQTELICKKHIHISMTNFYHFYISDYIFQIHSENYIIRVTDMDYNLNVHEKADGLLPSKLSFNINPAVLVFNDKSDLDNFAARIEKNILLF